ncbi:MAG: hypothetical protein WD316_12940 [Phycisphaeraceae bacterium]
MLDHFNDMIRARDRRAGEHIYVAIEVPPTSPSWADSMASLFP